MSVFSHLLFDFDHMLFDTDASEAQAFVHALEIHGVFPAQPHLDQYQQINQQLWREVEAGAISPNEVKTRRFKLLAEQASFTYDALAVAETYAAGLAQYGELYAGASELLERCASRFTLGMVTNGLGPVQRGRIDRTGIGDYFSVTTISGEVGVSKPRPEIFSIARSALGDPPLDACLMIGDSLASDIAGGSNAGIATAWFNPAGNAEPKPGDGRPLPTFTFSTFGQLASLLE